MNEFLAKAVSSFVTPPVWMFLFGLSAVLAVIGPFGTFESLSLPLRFLYWAPIVLGANIFVRSSNRIVDQLFPDVAPFRWQILSIAAFSVTFSPSVWAYSGLFSVEFQSLDSLLFITLNVLSVTATVGMLVYFMTHDHSISEVEKPRLYHRLPAVSQSPIVRLTVDDHYVEVHLADQSTHRILMRFADAVLEMDETPGFCTHRSHWVAAAYVQNSLREKNRDYLLLETGTKVPVSKTYREAVQAAGFL